ncbi:MAG: hypothetical protein AB7T59_11715 [Hyphomonadaceae bacterium]
MRSLVLLAFVLSACVAGASSFGGAAELRLQPLSDEEIAEEIEGHAIIITRARETRRPIISERYCDGRIVIVGTRIPMYGAYEIRDGLLCHRFDEGGQECARVLRSANGALYRQWVSNSDAAPVQMDIIEMECD